MAELEWKQKQQLGIDKITTEFGNATKEIIRRELEDTASKINMLHKMGLIKDNSQMELLRKKMAELKLEVK